MTGKNAVRERGTIDDAVAILGVCARTVRNMALRGELLRAAAMATRPALADVGIAPRLLTREQAAAYCGVSLRTFVGICLVRPVALGASKRLQRYVVRAIDQWIDTLPCDKASYGKDWLATLDTDHDDHARKRT